MFEEFRPERNVFAPWRVCGRQFDLLQNVQVSNKPRDGPRRQTMSSAGHHTVSELRGRRAVRAGSLHVLWDQRHLHLSSGPSRHQQRKNHWRFLQGRTLSKRPIIPEFLPEVSRHRPPRRNLRRRHELRNRPFKLRRSQMQMWWRLSRVPRKILFRRRKSSN